MRLALPLALFVLLIALLALGLGRDPKLVPSPFIGKPAPPLDVPALSDPAERVTTTALRGAPLLVNVWASWCAGCREEHATLMALAREPGVRILGLNYRDKPADARAVLDSLGDPYIRVGVDEPGRAGIDWGVYGVPETFVLDADGIVRHKFVGPIDARSVRETLMPMLKALGAGGSSGATP